MGDLAVAQEGSPCSNINEDHFGMNNKFLLIGVIYLISLLSFLAGMYVIMARAWPYEHVMSVRSFLIGGAEEQKSVTEKIVNDLGLKPNRLIKTYQISDMPREGYRSINIPKADPRRASALIYTSDRLEPGLRLLWGALDTREAMHGAILVDSGGTIVHQWAMVEESSPDSERQEWNKHLHGLEVLGDGSVIYSFDGGNGLYRINACGELLWKIEGNFHHSISRDESGSVWTWRDHEILKVGIENGEVLRKIDFGDLDRANLDLDLFKIRQKDGADASTWSHDPHHPNDVEPLLPADATAYPQFNVGDLLISFRSLNLVFVIDPMTFRVKWWRIGQWRRQHDPDWYRDGKLYVYDNNMHRGESHITQIDPLTMVAKRVIRGKEFDFYSSHMGKFDITPAGGFLVASSQQGRAFEVSKAGEMTFDFINRYNNSGEVLLVAGAEFLAEDFFIEGVLSECD